MSNIGKVLAEFVTDHLDGVHPFTIRPIFQGTVTSLGAIGNSNPGGTVQVKRPGDINPTGYNYRVPSWYVPAVGDTVIVLNVPKTPLVLCRVANSLFDTLNPPANATAGSPGQIGFRSMTASPQVVQLRMDDNQSGTAYPAGIARGYGGDLTIYSPYCLDLLGQQGNSSAPVNAQNTFWGVLMVANADVVQAVVKAYSTQTHDLQQWLAANSTPLASMDFSGRLHAAKTICNAGPCIASGINAGIASATVSLSGSDEAGSITFTTTATPPAAGATLMTLTFAGDFPSGIIPRVMVQPYIGAPPTNGIWQTANLSSASWQLTTSTALAALTSYTIVFLAKA